MNGRQEAMETIPKYDYMIERLQKGEKVKCKVCQKGIYQPFNPKYKINHAYVCDNCGSSINIDYAVEVK